MANIFESFIALVNNDISARKAEMDSLNGLIERERAAFAARMQQIQDRQNALEFEIQERREALENEISVRSEISERTEQLKSLRLSDEVVSNTVLQILAEQYGLAFTGSIPVNAQSLARASAGNRESKDALRARVLGALTNNSFTTVKELSERLDKNSVQVNGILSDLAKDGKVHVEKASGSRTLLYKLA